MFRNLLCDILIAVITIFTVDLCAVMLQRIGAVVRQEDYRRVFRVQCVFCAVLLLTAMELRLGVCVRLPLLLLRICLIAASCVILFCCGQVILEGRVRNDGSARYALILGMALEYGKPPRDLMLRLDTARRYWEAHPDTVLIPTGGNPDPSGRTEAEVMREELLRAGIPSENILPEDQAVNTKANFINTLRMISPDEPVALISSNYHMHRAVRTAREAGFVRILRIPAPSELESYGANLMSEAVLNIRALAIRFTSARLRH